MGDGEDETNNLTHIHTLKNTDQTDIAFSHLHVCFLLILLVEEKRKMPSVLFVCRHRNNKKQNNVEEYSLHPE